MEDDLKNMEDNLKKNKKQKTDIKKNGRQPQAQLKNQP